MKVSRVLISMACAALLAACDTQRLPSQADAQASDIRREGALIVVPQASPLHGSLFMGQVAQDQAVRQIDAPGVIEARAERLVKITPPLGGRIVRLHHQLGDEVQEGDALVTLDSPELGQAYSEHFKAQAALKQARLAFKRQQLLRAEDIAAQKDIEAAQLELSAAESEARAAADYLSQLGVSTRDASRREYVLRSPIKGRVVQMEGFQGGYWNDNTASIMTVADLSTVWLSASVAEKDLAQMSVGQRASISLNAYADQRFEGEVRYIGDLLDTETRTVPVRVAIDNPEGLFKPGMFARVSFSGPAHQALLVPLTALVQSGLYTRVFVEQEPTRYESRIVEVGARIGDRAEVLSGLNADERIVIKGGVLLND